MNVEQLHVVEESFEPKKIISVNTQSVKYIVPVNRPMQFKPNQERTVFYQSANFWCTEEELLADILYIGKSLLWRHNEVRVYGGQPGHGEDHNKVRQACARARTRAPAHVRNARKAGQSAADVVCKNCARVQECITNGGELLTDVSSSRRSVGTWSVLRDYCTALHKPYIEKYESLT